MFGYNEMLSRFIVIEGIDGAGTSTQRQLLCQALRVNGRKILDTWEPSEGPVGQLIRNALKGTVTLTPATVAYLFAADRHEHLDGPGGIRQSLALDEWVVCDRYILSSLAYQGLLIGDEAVWQLNQNFPLPEYLIFVDVDTETSTERRHKRGGIEEIYDQESFQAKVRSAYHRHIDQLRLQRPELKIKRFDGSQSVSKLHRDICDFLGISPI